MPVTGHPKTHGGFHPYRKERLHERISRKLSRKGVPPLELILLACLVFLVALFPIYSMRLLSSDGSLLDISIAIQTPEGMLVKGASISLTALDKVELRYFAQMDLDGLAHFPAMKANERLLVYAEKDGKIIELEKSELKVPSNPEGGERIIVLTAV